MDKIVKGDLCVSVKGRDKDRVFLVIDSDGRIAKIVDGKTRKVNKPKRKNVKHLLRIEVDGFIDTATDIQNGVATGNSKLYKRINATIKNRED